MPGQTLGGPSGNRRSRVLPLEVGGGGGRDRRHPGGDGEDAHVLRAEETLGAPEGARNRSRLAMNAKQEAPERQEIEELLPWHAAGTLSRRDAQRVEEALARDPELARRYALVREELGETISLNETLGHRQRVRWKICSPRSTPSLHASRRRLSISAAVSANSLPACHHARSPGRQPPLHWRSWCRPDFSRTSC